MFDLRLETSFIQELAAARAAIAELYRRGVPDAEEFERRSQSLDGLHNRVHALLPLAVIFAQHFPDELDQLRAQTSLRQQFIRPDSEALMDQELWAPIMAQMRQLIAERGYDAIPYLGNGLEQRPQLIADIAASHLSEAFGGGRPNRNAHDSSLKLILKLLAHARAKLRTPLPLIQSIRLENILSYHEAEVAFELLPLNILTGANGSGKSNLIESLRLLSATPKDLQGVFLNGGANEWLWKGAPHNGARLAVTVARTEAETLFYELRFRSSNQRLVIQDETVAEMESGNVCYRYRDYRRQVEPQIISPEFSVLGQLRDPTRHPEIAYLGRQFGAIQIYGGWDVGRDSPMRQAQPAAARRDVLEGNGQNLALVLHALDPAVRRYLIVEQLRLLMPGVEEIETREQDDRVVLLVHEAGMNRPTPAARLSAGVLRYLALLTVLLHPTPPPLICIEEPETGLHPDIIPSLANLLVAASQRTQLIMTTHSVPLISALTSYPEAIVVCERDRHGTTLRRLDGIQLRLWLEEYM